MTQLVQQAQQAMTANRLRDGQVVYLCEDDSWSEHIEHSIVADTEDLAKTLQELGARAAAQHAVVDPYLFPVSIENGRIRPLSRREEIRAAGPSVRPDLGYQAAAE
jgi:hypothetical protein